MKENVGKPDRLARVVLGPSMMVVGYTVLGGSKGKLSGLLAMVAGTAVVESAITRVCPINAAIGIDTRSRRERRRDLRRLVV